MITSSFTLLNKLNNLIANNYCADLKIVLGQFILVIKQDRVRGYLMNLM